MIWIPPFRDSLIDMDLPNGWQIQLGSDEAYVREEGTWKEIDPMDVGGRMLEDEEVKLVPSIGDLHVVAYFIPRTTLQITQQRQTRLSRHITVTMRPYYQVSSDEEAVNRFWQEYGEVVSRLESLDYELRNQDVDYNDETSEYNYFIDTCFWKSLREATVEEVVREFQLLAQSLSGIRRIDGK